MFDDDNRLAVRSDHPVPFGQDRFYFEIEVLELEIEYAYVFTECYSSNKANQQLQTLVKSAWAIAADLRYWTVCQAGYLPMPRLGDTTPMMGGNTSGQMILLLANLMQRNGALVMSSDVELILLTRPFTSQKTGSI